LKNVGFFYFIAKWHRLVPGGSMSRARSERLQIREIIETFLRDQPEYNRVTGTLRCSSGEAFDAAFRKYRQTLYEAHQAGCPVCVERENCVELPQKLALPLCVEFGALLALTPDPYTGVISELHEYLLKNGRFEAVSTRGEVYIAPAPRAV
jgi:hypothetical protein